MGSEIKIRLGKTKEKTIKKLERKWELLECPKKLAKVRKAAKEKLTKSTESDKESDKETSDRQTRPKTTERRYTWIDKKGHLASRKLTEYECCLEDDVQKLQDALFSLSSHYAKIQFRLRQIASSTGCERLCLLRDLEKITSQGIDANKDNDELPNLLRDSKSFGNVRLRQKAIITQLRSRLSSLLESPEIHFPPEEELSYIRRRYEARVPFTTQSLTVHDRDCSCICCQEQRKANDKSTISKGYLCEVWPDRENNPRKVTNVDEQERDKCKSKSKSKKKHHGKHSKKNPRKISKQSSNQYSKSLSRNVSNQSSGSYLSRSPSPQKSISFINRSTSKSKFEQRTYQCSDKCQAKCSKTSKCCCAGKKSMKSFDNLMDPLPNKNNTKLVCQKGRQALSTMKKAFNSYFRTTKLAPNVLGPPLDHPQASDNDKSSKQNSGCWLKKFRKRDLINYNRMVGSYLKSLRSGQNPNVLGSSLFSPHAIGKRSSTLNKSSNQTSCANSPSRMLKRSSRSDFVDHKQNSTHRLNGRQNDTEVGLKHAPLGT